MRLDRFFSGQTALARKEAAALIKSGAVSVNGTVIRRPDAAVDPENDRITLRGEPVLYQKHRYILLHKPAGVITASRDRSQKTVLDLLKPEDRLPGLSPAGRLDKDTSGLLLITDDGQLTHRMLAPKTHAPKFYLAALRDPFTEETAARFRAGMMLREGDTEEPCLPAESAAIAERLAVIELHEGKYHQVRRMFAAAGNFVENLLRVQIGMLQLPPDLPAGAYLHIFHKDAESVLRKTHISDVCAFISQNYSSYWINRGK
ncbi:MAG: rRNA pseudouridine synthase [Oscillospiraceae bacterium]|nr:rRNA pseudouridine synthase [Oscillospiraceae bacterium]